MVMVLIEDSSTSDIANQVFEERPDHHIYDLGNHEVNTSNELFDSFNRGIVFVSSFLLLKGKGYPMR
jgi:hypothetical protein